MIVCLIRSDLELVRISVAIAPNNFTSLVHIIASFVPVPDYLYIPTPITVENSSYFFLLTRE